MKRKGNTKKVDELYDYLHDNFEYREDGNLVRLFDSARSREYKAGSILGSLEISKGQRYKTCTVLRKTQAVHRMIFLFCNGYLPKLVDHGDRDKLNNCEWNLREISSSGNNFNVRRECKYGYVGVRPSQNLERWVSWICIDGKKSQLGTFDTRDEAVFARREAEMELYGEYSSSYPQVEEEEKDCGHCNGTGKVKKSEDEA